MLRTANTHLQDCCILLAKQASEAMTRGNQRDTDRARAAARTAKAGGKPQKEIDGLTKDQRRARDAAAMQAKIEAKKKADAEGK
jgi:hypothetical protein